MATCSASGGSPIAPALFLEDLVLLDAMATLATNVCNKGNLHLTMSTMLGFGQHGYELLIITCFCVSRSISLATAKIMLCDMFFLVRGV